MSINLRVREFAEYKRIKQKELGEILEVSRGSVSQALIDKSNFTQKSLSILVDRFPELNARWLLTGKGQMLVGGEIEKGDGDCLLCEEKEKRIAELERTIQAKDEIIRLLKEPK